MFKVGDYVYAGDWCSGTIVEIDGDTACVEFETGGGGGTIPFDIEELEHAPAFHTAISNMCYELYMIDWKQRHNIGRKEEVESVKQYYKHLEEIGEDDSYFPYKSYLNEFGFNGEVWACFSEFCLSEYRGGDYIRGLLGDEELIAMYRDDIDRR